MPLMATLPSVLASAAARKRVAALEGMWPGGAAARILELRLDGRGRAVDVSHAYRPDGLAALAALARRRAGLAPLLAILTWCAAKGRPRSLWLEWDLPDGGPDAAAALPSLFLSCPEGQGGDPRSHFGAALCHLDRRAMLPAFDEVLDRLAAGMSLRQIGVMLSRPDPVVRLVLDIGAPGQARALLAALRPDLRTGLDTLFGLPGFAAAPRLDLDLTPDGIGPRLSLERPAVTLAPGALTRALTDLADLGIIDPAAAAALAALAPWQSCGPQSGAGLNHLKASVTAGGDAIEIKAYLGLVTASEPVPA